MLGSKNKKTANVNARIGSIIGADMVVEGLPMKQYALTAR